MFGKAVLVVNNTLVGRFHILGFVRRFANQHRVENDSHGPDIDFKRMTPLGLVSLNDFGRNIIGRAANGFAFFVLVFQSRR